MPSTPSSFNDDTLSVISQITPINAYGTVQRKPQPELPSNPEDDIEIIEAKRRSILQHAADIELREALDLKPDVSVFPLSDSALETTFEDHPAEYAEALAHFAKALEKPIDCLIERWQERVLTSLPHTKDVHVEIQKLLQLHATCLEKGRRERECAKRQEDSALAVKRAAIDEEKAAKGRKRPQNWFHKPGQKARTHERREKADEEEHHAEEEYQGALAALNATIDHYSLMTEEVKSTLIKHEADHSQAVSDVVKHAAIELQGWASDAKNAISHLKRPGDYGLPPGGVSGLGDGFRHNLAHRANLPPGTPTTTAEMSGASTPSTLVSIREHEDGLSCDLLEEHISRLHKENENLRQDYLEQRQPASHSPRLPTFSGSASMQPEHISEEYVSLLFKENQELEKSAVKHMSENSSKQLRQSQGDLEQEVLEFERLAHACFAVADQIATRNACATNSSPSRESPRQLLAASGILNSSGVLSAEDEVERDTDEDDKGHTRDFGDECRTGSQTIPTISRTHSWDNITSPEGDSPSLARLTTGVGFAGSEAFANLITRSPDGDESGLGREADAVDGTSSHRVGSVGDASENYIDHYRSGSAGSDMAIDVFDAADTIHDSRSEPTREPILEASDEGRQPRPAMLKMPTGMLSLDDSEADPLPSGTPRHCLVSPTPSYKGFVATGPALALGIPGCLPQASPQIAPRNEDLFPLKAATIGMRDAGEVQLDPIFDVRDLESALADSDRSLYKDRISENKGYWNWDITAPDGENEEEREGHDRAKEKDGWNFACEELENHELLHQSTFWLCNKEKLADDEDTQEASASDLNCFAYELLLLLHEVLSDGDGNVKKHVEEVLYTVQISLGINSTQQLHIAALTLPENDEPNDTGYKGSQSYHPLDIRYRAGLLLKSWMQSESPCFGVGTFVSPDSHETKAWIRRQLKVLRGSAILRAARLHHDAATLRVPESKKWEIRETCKLCLQICDKLTEIYKTDKWGKPTDNVGEASGSRLIVCLLQCLDSLRPEKEIRGHWKLDTIFATQAFGKLWMAAVDPYSEDHLSPFAPQVATALLSGLHPLVGSSAISFEYSMQTHALLLAQQIWKSISVPSVASKAINTAAELLVDFSKWLMTTPVETGKFGRHSRVGGDITGNAEVVEVTMRRILSNELRNTLTEKLKNYRRHFDPEAFSSALSLWRNSHLQTSRSEILGLREALDDDDDDDSPRREPYSSELPYKSDDGDAFGEDDQVREFLRRMGHWFVWNSVGTTCEHSMKEIVKNAPPNLSDGSLANWKAQGQKIKDHMENVANAIKSLRGELDCEKEHYNVPWETEKIMSKDDHLGVTVAALCAAVRPKIRDMVDLGLWSEQIPEIPPGGCRLLQELEGLDRLSGQYREPRQRKEVSGTLVDMLRPYAGAALKSRFDKMNQDIVEKTLEGSDEDVYKALRPPSLLHCEGCVSVWRFINESLDAPLTLGLPVDLVVEPFMVYLRHVISKMKEKLKRDCEEYSKFAFALRAEKVTGKLQKIEEWPEIDYDDEDDRPETSKSEEGKKGMMGKLKGKLRIKRTAPPEQKDVGKNVVLEAAMMNSPDKQDYVSAPIKQVLVRISSIGFCLSELYNVRTRILDAIGEMDRYAENLTAHDTSKDAHRNKVKEGLDDCKELLEHEGNRLARYLATRLIFWELRSDLFEKLYYISAESVPSKGGGGAGGGDSTPRGGTPRLAQAPNIWDSPAPACLALQDILENQQGTVPPLNTRLKTLLRQMPAPLVPDFVVEIGKRLAYAWNYVVMDYVGKQKKDQIKDAVEDDQESLRTAVEELLELAWELIEAHPDKVDLKERLHNRRKQVWAAQDGMQKFLRHKDWDSHRDCSAYAVHVFAEDVPVEKDKSPCVGGTARGRTASPRGGRRENGSRSPSQGAVHYHPPELSRAASREQEAHIDEMHQDDGKPSTHKKGLLNRFHVPHVHVPHLHAHHDDGKPSTQKKGFLNRLHFGKKS